MPNKTQSLSKGVGIANVLAQKGTGGCRRNPGGGGFGPLPLLALFNFEVAAEHPQAPVFEKMLGFLLSKCR